jgi:hypothetical protein
MADHPPHACTSSAKAAALVSRCVDDRVAGCRAERTSPHRIAPIPCICAVNALPLRGHGNCRCVFHRRRSAEEEMVKNFLMWPIALLIVGCADPFVGKWEGTEDSAVDLDVREAGDGYEGGGHVYYCDASACTLCRFDFDGTEVGDDRYELDVKFTGLCQDIGTMNGVDCDLTSDTRLECTFPDGPEIEYEKVD